MEVVEAESWVWFRHETEKWLPCQVRRPRSTVVRGYLVTFYLRKCANFPQRSPTPPASPIT